MATEDDIRPQIMEAELQLLRAQVELTRARVNHYGSKPPMSAPPQAYPGRAPKGNRTVGLPDLAYWFGETKSWWDRKRPILVEHGLLVKAGRRFIGDLQAIQDAIGNPDMWPDE